MNPQKAEAYSDRYDHENEDGYHDFYFDQDGSSWDEHESSSPEFSYKLVQILITQSEKSSPVSKEAIRYLAQIGEWFGVKGEPNTVFKKLSLKLHPDQCGKSLKTQAQIAGVLKDKGFPDGPLKEKCTMLFQIIAGLHNLVKG